jgi:hypothetical protein
VWQSFMNRVIYSDYKSPRLWVAGSTCGRSGPTRLRPPSQSTRPVAFFGATRPASPRLWAARSTRVDLWGAGFGLLV